MGLRLLFAVPVIVCVAFGGKVTCAAVEDLEVAPYEEYHEVYQPCVQRFKKAYQQADGAHTTESIIIS